MFMRNSAQKMLIFRMFLRNSAQFMRNYADVVRSSAWLMRRFEVRDITPGLGQSNPLSQFLFENINLQSICQFTASFALQMTF